MAQLGRGRGGRHDRGETRWPRTDEVRRRRDRSAAATSACRRRKARSRFATFDCGRWDSSRFSTARTLSAGRTAGAEQSKFEVTEAGELHLTNGPGQIATEKEFARFRAAARVQGERRRAELGRVLSHAARTGGGRGTRARSITSSGRRSDEAGRLWHGRHLSPAAGAARRGGRSRVVHDDDRTPRGRISRCGSTATR